ncbi:MAG: F0F1 ATP synthase subunit gamma [candidate division WS1 bacterium]|jgi:F-type H+-transporting ATPase subunit gamma|nr:F0F1 ATP synthase subunit gamma [candidate division WS1 bacterium]
METIEILRDKIGTAESLQSVVSTMKSLAAVSIQQLEGVIRSIDEYNRTVELGLQIALRNRPRRVQIVRPVLSDALGAVIIGSDQGMCGQFNEDIVSHAVEDMQQVGVEGAARAILAVGARTVAHLELAGLTLDDLLATPASPGTISPLVQQIAMQIERWQTERGFDRIFLYYNHRVSAGRYRPSAHRLLPMDAAWLERIAGRRWPTKMLPQIAMPWRPLISELIQQHILVVLNRVIVHSMMSEHTARMQSMQAAEQNIDERLEELRNRFRQTRQTAITAELLDIVSGFEILRSERDV